MTFGEWLTRKRLEVGVRYGKRVTQAEIARKAGISRQYLGFLEAGTYPTPGKTLDRELVYRLADALEADEEDALAAAGIGESLTDDEREILRRYRRLDEKQSVAFRQFLETFLPKYPPVRA